MSRWADKAVDQLEEDLERGEISEAEYKESVRDIRAELEAEASEAAEQAYRDTMGY